MALVNDSRFLGPCAPTDAEAADLRATSALLLMSGAAQALAATLALLVPKRAPTFLACVVASRADYLANDVIRMVVGCHGHVQGALAVHYCLLVAMKLAALTSAFFVVALGEE
uniref:Uncharacterized protein n=1 Tax=Arundo donax TaxID=35708 RepID=A0A0A8ZJV2_ARUDO